MKKGNFFANCVFAVSVIFTVLSFSACTDDSNDVVATTSEVIEQAEVPFSVVLKAMNSDGNDITTKGEVNGATLFVFDQNNDFFEQINVNKSTILSRRAIDINCPNSNDITVIAWSGINSGNEEISNMSKANIISDLQVSLKENNGIANIPSVCSMDKLRFIRTLQQNPPYQTNYKSFAKLQFSSFQRKD